MPYSMSTHRRSGITRSVDHQPVTVYGYDADGGEDGLPVVVARGTVTMGYDGPSQCRVYDKDGAAYVTAETSWSPLRGEWTCEARKIQGEGS